jgi:hypothetical protein
MNGTNTRILLQDRHSGDQYIQAFKNLDGNQQLTLAVYDSSLMTFFVINDFYLSDSSYYLRDKIKDVIYQNSGDFVVQTANVGIGVADPTEALDVNGNVNVSDSLFVGGGVGIGVSQLNGELLYIQGDSNYVYFDSSTGKMLQKFISEKDNDKPSLFDAIKTRPSGSLEVGDGLFQILARDQKKGAISARAGIKFYVIDTTGGVYNNIGIRFTTGDSVTQNTTVGEWTTEALDVNGNVECNILKLSNGSELYDIEAVTASSLRLNGNTYSFTGGGFVETDPIYAGDSADIVWFSDIAQLRDSVSDNTDSIIQHRIDINGLANDTGNYRKYADTTYATDRNYYVGGGRDDAQITNNGDGTITVCCSTVWLWDNPDHLGYVSPYNLTSQTLTLTAQTINYVIADYNSGSPVIDITTNVLDINESDVMPLYTIFTDGTDYRYLSWESLANGLANKQHYKDVKVNRFEKAGSGLVTSDSLSNYFNVTAGTVWYGVREIDYPYYSSLRDSVSQFYLPG